MKAVLRKEEQSIGDLRRQHVHRNSHRQKLVKTSPAQASGNITTAYYRGIAQGQKEGMREACRVLKEFSPEAAKWLRKKLKER